jgi:fructokinase
MFDVVALGELLIDFTPAGSSSSGNVLYERNPGGAPANVLASVSKFGGKSAFIGMVGYDQFGFYLKDVLEKNNICTDGLVFSKVSNTTLAFVHLDKKGDRSFSFYRKPGADTILGENDVNFNLIDNTKIFHFGSLSMTNEPSRGAALKAVSYARGKGKMISYDPNWRPPLWESEEAARAGMLLGFKYADVVKVSEVELEFLTGEADFDKGSRILLDMGIKLVAVTLGPKGCYYRCASGGGLLSTYKVNVVDTTGAGDAFMGALLYHLSSVDVPLNELDLKEIESMVNFSNAAGSLCTTERGAIPAIPTLEQVKYCMENIPRY